MRIITQLTTNSSGYYEAPFLLAGAYRLTVENAGFKKLVRSGITLGIGDRLQVDLMLEIGGTVETVTVTSEAPMRQEPVNNYLATGMPNNVTYSSWNSRVDYQASNSHRFFFRWLKSSFLEDAQDYTYESEPGLMAWNERRPALSGMVDWTYVKGGATVMNISVDSTKFIQQNQRLGTRRYKPTDAGLPAYLDSKCADSCVMPRVIWPGMTAWSGHMVLSTTVDPGPTGRQEAVKYNLSHVRGSHTLRAGVDFRRHFQTQVQNGGFTSGNFTLADTYVRRDEDGFNPAGTLGLTWATFILGIPSGMSVDTNDTYAATSPF